MDHKVFLVHEEHQDRMDLRVMLGSKDQPAQLVHKDQQGHKDHKDLPARQVQLDLKVNRDKQSLVHPVPLVFVVNPLLVLRGPLGELVHKVHKVRKVFRDR